jgi:hypothetical protein
MEHQDRADPSEEAAQQGVQPAEIESVETGADDRRFHRDIFELRGGPVTMACVCDEFIAAGQFRQWLMHGYLAAPRRDREETASPRARTLTAQGGVGTGLASARRPATAHPGLPVFSSGMSAGCGEAAAALSCWQIRV